MILRRLLIGGLVLMLLGWQYRLWIGEGSLAHVHGLNEQVKQMQVVNATKQQRNKVLINEIIDLKTGHAAIEEKARTEWGLIKEGETFFLLIDKQE